MLNYTIMNGKGHGHVFNFERLAHAFKEKRNRLKLTLAQVTAETGLSTATLSRLESKSDVSYFDLTTVSKVADWIDEPVTSFIRRENELGVHILDDNSNHTLEYVEALLRADKELSPEDSNALVDLVRNAYKLARGT